MFFVFRGQGDCQHFLPVPTSENRRCLPAFLSLFQLPHPLRGAKKESSLPCNAVVLRCFWLQKIAYINTRRQTRAWLVLGWGTACRVLSAFARSQKMPVSRTARCSGVAVWILRLWAAQQKKSDRRSCADITSTKKVGALSVKRKTIGRKGGSFCPFSRLRVSPSFFLPL